jgi:hypothetical protein
MSKKSDLDKAGCGDGSTCPASQRDNVDSYNSLRIVSGVGLIAGIALAGAGAYLLLTTPAGESEAERATASRKRRSPIASVRLSILPGGTLLSGEF